MVQGNRALVFPNSGRALARDVIINCPERPVVVNTNELFAPVFWSKPISSSLGSDVLPVMSNYKSGDNFAVGNTKIQYRYQNLHCEFTVIVQETKKDISPPIVHNCPHDPITIAVQSLHDKVILTLPEPYADDDSCDQVAVTSSGNLSDTFCVGLTTVIYNFTDSSENVAQCVIKVNVSVIEQDSKRDYFPIFEFCPLPISINGSSEFATTQITWTEPVLNSSMLNLSLQQSHFSGDQFPIGITNVVYRVTDIHNRQRSEFCNFSITVNDVTPPTIFSCPETITVKSCRGQRNVNWFEPFASDNSGGPTTVWQTHNPGNHSFHFGTAYVSYFFKDESNNVAECSFNVTVHANGCYVIHRVLITFFSIAVIGFLIVFILLHICIIFIVRCCHNSVTADEAT
ncbi:Hyalin [Holothuria leucospilota]|uniref:Hyalin n=1 Tax=Holothuria leucospilota TaxID=206669 RepID=A0A9Q1BXA0_HOLLE|nr:Hyalin [Holothuria leucospilota]